MSRRFQFSLKALLVAMLVVAAFFGGMALQKQLDKPVARVKWGASIRTRWKGREEMTLRDGTTWYRDFDESLLTEQP